MKMIGYKVIEASELFEMMADQKILLVDVRNDAEVATGTIPGAMHIPLSMIPVTYEQLKTDTAVVFYCHSGIRSAQAAAYIASKDHPQVFNLHGGILAWGREGYPFEQRQS
ncbi:MAG: rhodanese-like domain-containing protein [Pseudomonadota bacterium]